MANRFWLAFSLRGFGIRRPLRGNPEYSWTGEWLHWFAQAWTNQPSTLLLVATAAVFLTLMVFAAYVVWRED